MCLPWLVAFRDPSIRPCLGEGGVDFRDLFKEPFRATLGGGRPFHDLVAVIVHRLLAPRASDRRKRFARPPATLPTPSDHPALHRPTGILNGPLRPTAAPRSASVAPVTGSSTSRDPRPYRSTRRAAQQGGAA